MLARVVFDLHESEAGVVRPARRRRVSIAASYLVRTGQRHDTNAGRLTIDREISAQSARAERIAEDDTVLLDSARKIGVCVVPDARLVILRAHAQAAAFDETGKRHAGNSASVQEQRAVCLLYTSPSPTRL